MMEDDNISASVFPDHDAIAGIAAAELAALPDVFRVCVENIVFHVQDFADAEITAEMKLESPYDLLGLYVGVPMDLAGMGDVTQDLDRIFLYRQPLLAYTAETGEALSQVVRHVLVHEIGHHFGFSDDDMEALETAQ